MTLLNDLYQKGSFKILSEAKVDDGIMKILVPFTQTDEKNQNGRIYPKAIMQREVNRISKDISDGKMLGSADHPKSGNTELDKVSHIVSSMELDDAGKGWAKLKILDTTAGKNLKVILKSGGVLGVSTRGYGTFDSQTKMVKDDYKLTGLDVVANPSYKDGTFSQDNIFESLDLVEKKKVKQSSIAGFSKEGIVMKNKKMLEELREDSEFSRVTKRLYEDEKDFTGTLLEYAEENGLQIKAVLGVENGTWPDYEMAMIKLKAGEQMIANGKKQDGLPEKPVTPGDVRETARIAGVPASELAEAINKENARPADTEKRTALFQQVWASFGAKATREKVDEAVDRIMAANIRTEKPAPVVLSESEKKDLKRLHIKQQMNKDGFLAGFKKEQIDVAIAKRMAELDKKEMEE